ncbi:MAG TPA: FGGY-family carbohydrate kinase [Atribacteraceae bacterium]|nr:FGGY-family carbohydrate kinase [Atribacteraceae bacterium]
MSYLGIDVGTTGCKVIAFDECGRIKARAYREYPLYYPGEGWLELDADEVFGCVEDCLHEVSAKTTGDPPQSLAISAQGEAVVPVDREGRCLARSMVTFDKRGEEFVPYWEEALGRERFFSITGTTLSGIGTLNKIMWWQAHHPEIHEHTRFYLCFEDFVMYRMGLEPVMNYSLAARTMMFDVTNESWSPEILSRVSIDPEQLARTRPSGQAVGEVGESFRRKMGWKERVLVASGAHDQPSGALGAGVIRPGLGIDATGTVECIAPALSRLVLNDTMRRNNLCSYHHAYPDLYITLIYNFTGGSILRWYRDTFGAREVNRARLENRNVYSVILEELPEAPTSLLVLPHFTMSGTPHFDTASCGMVVGLRLETTSQEFIKALLEGVTLEMKYNLSLLNKAGVQVDRLRAVGGGAQNEKWLNLKANIFNVPVETLNISEAACLGAALLGRKALENITDFCSLVDTLVQVERVYEPQPETARRYEDKFAQYIRLYPALKECIQVTGSRRTGCEAEE